MTRVLVGFIRLYQRGISRFLPSICRFHPTCSSYAIEAFESRGFFRAFQLATCRILRCHPFHDGGFDPVPSLEPSE